MRKKIKEKRGRERGEGGINTIVLNNVGRGGKNQRNYTKGKRNKACNLACPRERNNRRRRGKKKGP